ncbi:MAG: phage shock protein A [Verrucomicrobiales bacterium]|jgi:phage shock protein A
MFKRLGNLIRGFIGLFVGGLEKRNPEALLEVEKENLRRNIVKFNQGLAAHAGLCERLMVQVKKQEKERDEFRAKTSAHLKAGNKQLAGQLAMRLQSVTADLSENSAQLEEAEKTYRELMTARDVSIKEARSKIEELRRGIDDMKVQSAMAELNEMAAGMVNEIGGSGDTLNRLQEMVEDERSKARGKARVAKDSIDSTEVRALEMEQSAMEEQALADFAAREGLTIESDSDGGGDTTESASEESGTKSMGPSETA